MILLFGGADVSAHLQFCCDKHTPNPQNILESAYGVRSSQPTNPHFQPPKLRRLPLAGVLVSHAHTIETM